jgi:isoquinoline 1-oxidoreductase subunit beta
VMSELVVHIIQSFEPPGGVGEAGTSAIVPAIANAIFAATGMRLRKMLVDATALKQLVNGAGTKNPF